VVNEAGESSVLCTPDSFEAVQQALARRRSQAARAEVVMRPPIAWRFPPKRRKPCST
jgi:transcriptional/translational regulatory protein YebC/TACO1